MIRRLFFVCALLLVAIFVPAIAQAQSDSQESFSDPEATDNHCGYTDETTSGPYYVSGAIETDELNYQGLDGEPIMISGVVYDGSTGEPIPNAQIEVWHADTDGNYYPNANGEAADFSEDELNLRGTVMADDEGAYQFTTIQPGIYENRRRHIHYYITADGYLPLFTQTYWPDDPNVDADNTDADTEACRMLTFEETEDGTIAATFDNYLRPDPDTIAVEATAEAVTCTRLDLNNLTENALLATIPNFSNRMVREFFEYRPYISIQQFRREIGKYVDDTQVAEWEQYVYVPVDVNNSDAATLMQLPGVDEAVAAELTAARPYESNAAFLEKLSEYVDAQQLAEAGCYLS